MAILRDPALDHLLGGQPRRRGAVFVALLASTAALTAVVIASSNGQPERKPAAASAPAESSPAVDSTQPVEPREQAPKTLVLPQPTRYEDGVPAGYPDTTAGAVAAAYGYSRLASGLDLDATLGVVEAIADPDTGWFARERSAMADGLVAQRAGLGLPPVGPAGSASLTIAPAGYQILGRDSHASTLRVLTLNIVSARATDGARTTGTVVLEWNLRWNGTRWLVTARYDSGTHDHLALTPMTTQAEAAGWKVATGG